MSITTVVPTGQAAASHASAGATNAHAPAGSTPFPVHTSETAPHGSRPAVTGVQHALGFLPNLFATIAESPTALTGYLALDGVLGKGSFSPAERQLILTAVSAANGCAYCMAAHSTFAVSLHAAPDALAAARGTGHADDSRLDALVGFVHAVVRARGHVAPEVVEHFFAAGLSPAQALEIAANVGLKTNGNYIDGFAHVPLDVALEPQRWMPNASTAA